MTYLDNLWIYFNTRRTNRKLGNLRVMILHFFHIRMKCGSAGQIWRHKLADPNSLRFRCHLIFVPKRIERLGLTWMLVQRNSQQKKKKEKEKERGMYMPYLPTPSTEVMRIRIIGQIEACGSPTVVIIDVSCTIQLCKCVISSRWIINRLAHLDHSHNTTRSKVS